MITLHEIGEMRLKMRGYDYKLQRAKQITVEGFLASKNPYLSLSGGKDSVAMLAVVDEVANTIGRDFMIWAHISDASFPGTVEIVEQCAEISNRELIIDVSEKSAFEVVEFNPNPKMFGKKGVFFEAITRFQVRYKTDLSFVGVRSNESARRKKAVSIHGSLFRSRTVTTDHLVCYPLAYMSTEDVAATIVKYNYPFHDIYSKEHHSGDVRNIRLGYLTSQDLLYKGTAVFIKYNYPDLFNKLATAMPEVRCFV